MPGGPGKAATRATSDSSRLHSLIVTDLERMGDQCVSITLRAKELNEETAAQTIHAIR